MRTSDKILLFTAIAGIAILTSMNLGLYAKYKKGDYTAVSNSSEFDVHQLPPVKRVVIKGLGSIHIYPSDSFRLNIAKDASSTLKFQVQDSTLIITGNALSQAASPNGRVRITVNSREPTPVDLYLGDVEKISSENSTVTLHGSRDSASARSYTFDLSTTHLNIGSYVDRNGRMAFWNSDSSVIYWKQVSVQAKQSEIDCARIGNIKSMALSLTSSSLQDHEFTLGRLTVISDGTSTMELHGRNAAVLNAVSK